MSKRHQVESPNPSRPDVDHSAKAIVIVESTKFGKDLRVERLGSGHGYVITIAGSRLVGPILDGMFTTYNDALNAIQMYVDTHKSRVK